MSGPHTVAQAAVGAGGKVIVACKCGSEVAMVAPEVTCPTCRSKVTTPFITIGPDTVIKAGDGPRGASIVITGGTLGPGSVVR